jgi:hypothetical protein
MKFKCPLLSLVCIMFVAGCSSNSPKLKDANPQGIDSLKTTSIVTKLSKDSIEEIFHQDTIIDGHKVQRDIFIEYGQNTTEKKLALGWRDSILQMRRVQVPLLADTINYIQNPFPELNGIYYPVHKFRGSLILAQQGEDPWDTYYTPALTSKGLIIPHMTEDAFFAYQKANRTADGVEYFCRNGANTATVLIKNPGCENKVQTWVFRIKHDYNTDTIIETRFLMPMKYALQLPVIESTSSLGVGDELDIHFDPIDSKE